MERSYGFFPRQIFYRPYKGNIHLGAKIEAKKTPEFDATYDPVVSSQREVNKVLQKLTKSCKVCIFSEGHKILRNLHLTFFLCSASQN